LPAAQWPSSAFDVTGIDLLADLRAHQSPPTSWGRARQALNLIQGPKDGSNSLRWRTQTGETAGGLRRPGMSVSAMDTSGGP